VRLLRALLAFLLLPGVVAFAAPWLLLRERIATTRPSIVGVGFLLIGALLLLVCVRDFYVIGQGTLAPWDPPTRLVRVGLYRFTRNPMYLAVTVMLCGWAIAYGSWELALYATIVVVAFQLRVVYGEEPWLAHAHGDGWREYAAQTPRWLW
jgi:protein-S-isoprenylcysteine O-methyltransferase Ste14